MISLRSFLSPAASLLLGGLSLLPCVSANAQSTEPLQPNGSFEADADADMWPDGWGKAKGGITWETEEGNHFLRLKSTEPGVAVMVYQPVKIPAGVAAVEVKWRQRISELKPGKQAWFDARIMMDFKDAEGKKTGSPSAPNTRKNTEGWQERTTSFLVPEGSVSLDFMPALFQVQSGVFDLDDVSIKSVDPAPIKAIMDEKNAAQNKKVSENAAARRAKAAALLAKEGSLLPNVGFEAKAKKGDAPADWNKAGKDMSWETEEGNRFLRFKTSEPGKMVSLYRLVDIPEGVKALEMTWRQRITGLKKGKLPWNDARIIIEFKTDTGKNASSKPSPPYSGGDTKGWMEKSKKFLVPDDALTMVFMPSLFEASAGAYDLDDIVLKPTEPGEILAAAEEARKMKEASAVPFEQENKARWPKELRVSGNRLVDPDGKEVWLQGMNAGGLETLPQDMQPVKSTVVGIDEWKANAIRLPMKSTFWFGESPYQKDGGKDYREKIDQIITLAANRGAYLVLDLHRFRAPNEEDVKFWKDAAARYKDHPAVLFDIFNEPHGTSWEVWRNGGFLGEKAKPGDEDSFLSEEEKIKLKKGFRAVGMQALVNAVRETGAKNIIVAGGLDWAYDLSGIMEGYALEDKGGNGIMYSTHIYPWKKGWQDKVLNAAEKYPIFVGEVGADIKKMDFMPHNIQEDAETWVPDMIALMQKHRLNWTGWCFHPSASPIMILDWKYTPSPFWGAPAKEALAGKVFELKKLR